MECQLSCVEGIHIGACHLPDKKKVENRGLLNWWKYNKKCGKLGKLSEERADMLQILSDMRDK